MIQLCDDVQTRPLEHGLAAFRARLRLLVLGYALAWCLGAVLLAVAAVGMLDYVFRFPDPGVRLICTILVCLTVGVTIWRFLWPALFTRLTDLDLARRVERRFPWLEDRLTSAVEFLRQSADDPQAGSVAMRRHVVAEALEGLTRVDLRDTIDPRPVRRAGWALLGVCLLVVPLAVVDLSSTRLALARLALPLSDLPWPKKNNLMLSDAPARLARGHVFLVRLVDERGAPLPRDAHVEYCYETPDHRPGEKLLSMTMAGYDAAGMTATLGDVERSFYYRAVGGDFGEAAFTETHKLVVVEPPALLGELQVTVHPPAYTGLAPYELASDEPVLVGSRLSVSGVSDKPLLADGPAWLRFDDDKPGESGRMARLEDEHAFSLSADGEQPLRLTQRGDRELICELVDAEGVRSLASAVRIRVVDDPPPTVSLAAPAADHQAEADAFVTPTGVLPLRVLAGDDLALHWVILTSGDEDQPAVEFLRNAAEVPRGLLREPPAAPRTYEASWDLGRISPPLKPGTRLSIVAQAADYRPSIARSERRRIKVVDPQELINRLTQRQRKLLESLQAMLKQERASKGAVAQLQQQLQGTGRMTKGDIERLQQAELVHRERVDQRLRGTTGSLADDVQRILDELANNQLDHPDIERRMQSFRDEIDRLAREHLPEIDRELNGARRDLEGRLPKDSAPESPVPDAAAAAPTLARAAEHQERVIEALEGMSDELSVWDNYRRFEREIADLRGQQQQLASETAEALKASEPGAAEPQPPSAVGSDPAQLEAAKAERLKGLATRQQALANKLADVEQDMEKMSRPAGEAASPEANIVGDALQHARRSGVDGQMRAASQAAKDNQLGRAIESQSKAIANLDEMLGILANRRETELSRLVSKLRDAEKQLADLRARQSALQKLLRAAAQRNDEAGKRELERLTRQQKELQTEAEQLARSLKRLQAEQASRAAQKGASKMGQAGQQGQQGNGEQAAAGAQQAEQDLDEAQQRLAERRRQAEEELAAEQMARMEDNLKSLRDRQKNLLAETRHYDGLKSKQQALSHEQALSVRDLARSQRGLHADTAALAKKLSTAPVYELALEQVAVEMEVAGQQLARQEVAARTQQAQQQALDRLERILASLASDPPRQQQGGGGSGGGGGQAGGKRSLAELKLLKAMQEDINRRTASLEDLRRRNQTLTVDERDEYARLSEEQGKLADLLLEMTKPEPAANEDDLKDLLDDQRRTQPNRAEQRPQE